MNKKSELAKLLRQLADYVDSRSDVDLEPLFETARHLRKRAAPQNSHGNKVVDQEKLEDVRQQLHLLNTREEGMALLERHLVGRRALEAMARHLNLSVQRDDSVDRLRTKIVESAIGARLRSDAIQGRDR